MAEEVLELVEESETKKMRSVYVSNESWEGYRAYAQKAERSISYLIEQYGLTLHKKEVAPVEKGVRALKLVGFDTFWSLYPRKTAKEDAKKAWMQIRPDDREMVLDRLRSHRFPREVVFIPYPATWLKGKRYLDDPLTDLPLATAPARTDWDNAPEHLRIIHKKILDQQPLTELETDLVADFMAQL